MAESGRPPTPTAGSPTNKPATTAASSDTSVPRRVVVFVRGINSTVNTNARSTRGDYINDIVQNCTDPAADSSFGPLKSALIAGGFPHSDCRSFLNYSYNGKIPPDVRDGRFYPAPYSEDDTGQNLADSVNYLGSQLLTYQRRLVPSERLEFVLVGHSLGGVVALRYAEKVMQAREGTTGQLFPNVVAVMTIDSPVLGISPDDRKSAADSNHFGTWRQALPAEMQKFAELISANNGAAKDVTALWNTDRTTLAPRLASRGILSYTTGNQYDCIWRPWECGIPRDWDNRHKQWLFNWNLQTRNVQRLPSSDGPEFLPGAPLTGPFGGGPCQPWSGGLDDKKARLRNGIFDGLCVRDRHRALIGPETEIGNQNASLASWIKTLGRNLSIGDTSISEGNNGTVNTQLSITRGGLPTFAVSVNYATGDGTATGGSSCTAGADYLIANGTLTFAPGETTKIITVQVCGDTVVEPDETFYVILSSPVNGTIARAQGIGIISNDDSTGAFIPTGSLHEDRACHTSTLLPNGKVLVAGGGDPGCGSGQLSSAELYDPSTGTWSVTGTMAIRREFQTATRLPNGKVLMVGGTSGDASETGTAELYDSATGTFSLTGTMHQTRAKHTATLLPNGKVLVAGGAGYDSCSLVAWTSACAEIYDPSTGTWSPAANMQRARAWHVAALLATGKVLIAGGIGVVGTETTAEIYDPVADSWTLTGAMTTANPTDAIILPSGNILVFGCSAWFTTTEIYNPSLGLWSAGAQTAGCYAGTNLLTTGKVLLSGGNTGSATVSLAGLYDPAANTFNATGNLVSARVFHGATLLLNGKVLISGGRDVTDFPIASAELYLP